MIGMAVIGVEYRGIPAEKVRQLNATGRSD
jgi:hypothetical protein